MKQVPISLSLEGRKCLIVGGGAVAERKIMKLLAAGATIHVIAPELTSKLQSLYGINSISWRSGVFDESDIDKKTAINPSFPFLIVAATNDREVNARLASIANNLKIPVSVSDDAEKSTFIFPSIIERKPVTIAISTDGNSPALAKKLRSNLSAHIPKNLGKLARFTQRNRARVKNNIFEFEKRQKLWHEVIDGNIGDMVLNGHEAKAKRAIDKLIDSYTNEETQIGEVYLVGAGPGDPELLTLKALRIMQKSTVILHDRLVSKEILELCNPDADLIYVGKRKADHSVPQELLNHMLVRLAHEGHRVCRLKGGDPFIFGRGGEEIDKLAIAGVNFQVVPGITAASGCASYAGIPLTHRDHAQSVTFITGHSAEQPLDWKLLCKKNQTLVIYMGLDKLDSISNELINNGLDSDTPAALIEQGTTSNQRVHIASVSDLLNTVKRANVQAPTIIIIGTVVSLHNQLGWFEEGAHRPTSVFSSGSEEEDTHGKRIR